MAPLGRGPWDYRKSPEAKKSLKTAKVEGE
jgi:hypothetical protein